MFKNERIRGQRANKVAVFASVAVLALSVVGIGLASNTSNFQQTITPGVLSVDIADGSYNPVASPSIAMGSLPFSFNCQTSSGTFGSGTEQIYIQNPDAADDGWTVSVAATATTDLWDSAGTDYDFNDPNGAGCTDGGDADSFGGQMTIDPTSGTLQVGNCSSCGTSNISLGSQTGFSEGITDSVTLLNAAAGSDDIGDWRLTGVDVDQEIPAEQAAAVDYDINMVVSIVAI